MKKLINIRGAVASGKTTAVRQFCEHMGFSVEIMHMNNADIPVSIIDSGRIVVLGNYANKSNCTGTDPLRFKNGKSATKKLIAQSITQIYRQYNPEIIVYEHMLTSQLFKSTKEIADVGRSFGYEYFGVQLYLSEKKRESLLEKRSGARARKKRFSDAARRVNRSTEMLNEGGYKVIVRNVERTEHDSMWKVVQDAVEASL